MPSSPMKCYATKQLITSLKLLFWGYGENREPDYCQNISLTPSDLLASKKQHLDKRESEAQICVSKLFRAESADLRLLVRFFRNHRDT